MIGLNHILFCFHNSGQISKQHGMSEASLLDKQGGNTFAANIEQYQLNLALEQCLSCNQQDASITALPVVQKILILIECCSVNSPIK